MSSTLVTKALTIPRTLTWFTTPFFLVRGSGQGARLVPMCCCCHHWFLQVFRHGDRSPVGTFPNDLYANYWPQGFGQLSKVWQ